MFRNSKSQRHSRDTSFNSPFIIIIIIIMLVYCHLLQTSSELQVYVGHHIGTFYTFSIYTFLSKLNLHIIFTVTKFSLDFIIYYHKIMADYLLKNVAPIDHCGLQVLLYANKIINFLMFYAFSTLQLLNAAFKRKLLWLNV